VIKITDQAKARIEEILEYHNGQFFKIGIISGGCSGMMYDFGLVAIKEEEDLEVSNRVLVDIDTVELLEDSILDFISEQFSQKFVVINPNETARCGCSKSFSV